MRASRSFVRRSISGSSQDSSVGRPRSGRQPRSFFYVALYLFCAVFAIIGLVFNIKMVPLNEARLDLSNKTADLRTVNKQLELTVFKLTSLEQLHQRAQELNMGPPSHVQFLYSKPLPSHDPQN